MLITDRSCIPVGAIHIIRSWADHYGFDLKGRDNCLAYSALTSLVNPDGTIDLARPKLDRAGLMALAGGMLDAGKRSHVRLVPSLLQASDIEKM